ncbi:MAG: hypothetical protein ACP5U1_13545 [Desulfomonilaceae bacterium]
MEIYDSKDIRLSPGQAIKALSKTLDGRSQAIGFFIRPVNDDMDIPPLVEVEQRAGLVRFKNVLLVLTIIKINNDEREIFDIWWNYHAPDGPSMFHKMSEQETIIFRLCDDQGILSSIETTNEFRRFFEHLTRILEQTKSWTEIEFERSVTGFCAQNYPKLSLWEMVRSNNLKTESAKKEQFTSDDYPGNIPADLKDFYAYTTTKGHCIRIIPSNRENEVNIANVEEILEPAPVKTVLRCGFRWLKGYPVAPVPFIPGHGLAIPPDDFEF